jgi:serine/threonine-protein kinase
MTSYPQKTTIPPEYPELGSRYEMLKKLGSGGMGAVFLANDKTLEKLVAIKILLPGLSRETIIRFQQEARTAAKLDHPNIVKVLDCGQTPSGDLYLIMDYVGSKSLEDLVSKKSRRLPVDEALPIFIQIASGLQHAHDHNVTHRDVKPSNIMLSEKTPGNVQLVDFGLAKLQSEDQKLTSTGVRVGSPLYMSPEQANGEEVKEGSDIYSLGCLMFRVLTGVPPLQGETYMDTIMMQREEIPPLINEIDCGTSFPLDLEHVIAKTLEKDPADRYLSARDLEHALRQVQENYLATFKPTVASRAPSTVGFAGLATEPQRNDTNLLESVREVLITHRRIIMAAVLVLIAVPIWFHIFVVSKNLDQPKLHVGTATLKAPLATPLENPIEVSASFQRSVMIDRQRAFDTMDKDALLREAEQDEDPEIKQFSSDPELREAFRSGKMKNMMHNPEKMALFSTMEFQAMQPQMAELWGDEKLVKVWADPLCQEFVRKPPLWILWETDKKNPKIAKFVKSANMQNLMSDERFQRLLHDPTFQRLILDYRFQNLLKDPLNMKMMRAMSAYRKAMDRKFTQVLQGLDY